MSSREKQVYRLFTYLFFAALLCHLLFAAFLIFNPDKRPLTNHRWEKAYRLFGVTGPFFSENRINSIPRVYCSLKQSGNEWSDFYELGREEFNQYHQHYFKYDQLLLSGLPRYLCRQINIQQDTVTREEYLQSLRRYIQLSNASIQFDSAIVVYTLESLVAVKTDTFFVKRIGGFEQALQ